MLKPARARRELPEFLNVPWNIRDLIVFVGAWFGIQIVVLFALKLLSSVLPWAAVFIAGTKSGDIGATFGLDLLDAAAGFVVVGLYLRHYNVGWRMVGWRRVDLRKALGYLLGLFALFYILSSLALFLVTILLPGFNADQAQNNDYISSANTHRNLALIALVLIPPVLEETIFRGFLFPALAKKWGVIWGALVSSLIFGIAHMQANISVYTFLLGLLLCFMYVRLRSIFPGMALHMLNNLLAFWVLSGK